MSRIFDTAQPLTSRRRGVAVAACLAMTALVAGCGGGDRVKSFQPRQIIAFGDENSAFETEDSASALTSVGSPHTAELKGMRYTINFVTIDKEYCASGSTSTVCTAPSSAVDPAAVFTSTSDTFSRISTSSTGIDPRKIIDVQTGTATLAPGSPVTVDRQISRSYFCSPTASVTTGIWVQTVARALGSNLSFGGDYCSQDEGNAKSYAAWGAKVDDVRAQFNAHRGELNDGVLVTIMAGQNDIMAAYDTYRLGNQEVGLELMREKGQQLAGVINDIMATGARVVFLTLPNMGLSPAAVADPAFARNLTRAFNGYDATGGLELSVNTKAGHKIVKVDGYSQVNNIVGSYTNAAACSSDLAAVKMPDGTLVSTVPLGQQARALLLNCTNENLVPGATLESHLWADARHLGPVAHAALANLTVSRVSDQL